MPAARPRKQAAKGNKFPPEFRYSTNADSTPSVKWAKRRDSTGYRDAKAPRESAFMLTLRVWHNGIPYKPEIPLWMLQQTEVVDDEVLREYWKDKGGKP